MTLILLAVSCQAVLNLDELVYDRTVGGSGGTGGGGAEGGIAGAAGHGGDAGQGGLAGAAGMGGSAGQGGVAGAGGSGGGTPTCDEQYGQVPSYQLCIENAVACEFYVYADMVPCNSVCALNGGSCLNAWDDTEPPGDHCERNGLLGCTDDTRVGLICRCTRG